MENIFLSYKNNRRMVGILGIALPVLLLIFSGLNESISACYHTAGRDLMVGVLISTGVFLSMYRGYELIDSVFSKIAGISMFFIALFPVANPDGSRVSFLNIPGLPSNIIHTSFSVIFFFCMGYMSIFIFTKSTGYRTKQKQLRNMVFKLSGFLIWFLIPTMGLVRIIVEDSGSFVFFAETIMLFAFGISWLIKGNTILKDE